jgi:NAD(P)-dependent dehydrogenase (short-subunit alcohol dehydrogenase family)
MRIHLKPLDEQVIVITGASSGIGLVTARLAASRGASVVLAARNASDLRHAVERIRASGGRAAFVAADVSDESQVAGLADAAIREFGRIDTWVNNAAVSMYGPITRIPTADLRRQFDVNYWGQVYGSRAAVPHLRRQGGALINVASALADRAIPLQGNYCAAKHALKAFTDALRMELEAEGAGISVTLIKPSSIDTPFFEKARSFLGVEPQPVPPAYAPEVVAEAIMAAACRPFRDLVAGGRGKILSLVNAVPRLTDKYMEKKLFAAQGTDRPLAGRPDNLYEPVADDGGERGKHWDGRTIGTSLYTAAVVRPERARALMAVAGALLVSAMLLGRRGTV